MVSPDMVHMVSSIKESLLGHMSRGVHTSGRLMDEQLLDTVDADVHIRTNMYDVPKQVTVSWQHAAGFVSRLLIE